ncbi:hypothetical protein F5Y07DRAFT_397519 [Xylaria sp. FL0933]|nr:hypothetical protein F5Y07DRAFT_397519 [Xylaria sp. FL0933]
MPPKKKATKGDPLTEREKEIMLAAWQDMKECPKLETDALATRLGYTNVRALMNNLYTIKTKLGLEGSFVNNNKKAASSSTAPAPQASGANNKMKRKAGDAEEGAIEQDGPAAGNSKKRAVTFAMDAYENSEDDAPGEADDGNWA